jgi:hypothetical protein
MTLSMLDRLNSAKMLAMISIGRSRAYHEAYYESLIRANDPVAQERFRKVPQERWDRVGGRNITGT